MVDYKKALRCTFSFAINSRGHIAVACAKEKYIFKIFLIKAHDGGVKKAYEVVVDGAEEQEEQRDDGFPTGENNNGAKLPSEQSEKTAQLSARLLELQGRKEAYKGHLQKMLDSYQRCKKFILSE